MLQFDIRVTIREDGMEDFPLNENQKHQLLRYILEVITDENFAIQDGEYLRLFDASVSSAEVVR